jgi:hypothetical protein
MIPREHYYGSSTNTMMQPAYDPQPQYIVGNGAAHLGGYEQQMPSNGDNRAVHLGGYQQQMLSNKGKRAVHMGGYEQQMPSNGGNRAVHLGGHQMPSYGGNYHMLPAEGAYFQPHNEIALPWNGGFQYEDGSSSSHSTSHVGTSSSWMQAAPNNGNFSNGAVHDLAIWDPAESSNSFASYPYMHTSGSPPRAVYPDQFTGDNSFFPDAPADFLNMGVGGNGMNYLGGYETQGSSNNLQY